ncbi:MULTISPECIES: DUF106 domain-containing protein [unclassified Halorhabdus]|uniref:DUF106 domain-containing protein n=1 Tax=unclassified Halorhabdus TaxID=2621901 RepID=UPI0023DA7542|nr:MULTISPECIES: DUF106 domain-containing protein [unclassified Halorhabdus]WEL18403.1 DUF106 domain-containing protein [Halorhabdus sp. SVX81]WEL22286.1 DUF106 domain-containing protein [Halorhabdus sp. BNX81]
MARTGEKIDRLVAEDASMEAAIETVLATAEEQGTVAWGDVSDELTSGQWGRLIETGLLVDADGDGFVIDDPDGVHDALAAADPDSDDDDGGWSTWDKLAGVGVIALFLGYSLTSVRNVVGGTLDLLLGNLITVLGGEGMFYLTILVLATLTGLWSTLLQDNLMDMSGMSQHQEKMEELKERREAAKERDDQEELDRIQQEQMEMMSDQLGAFTKQFRPMVWIMLLTIPVFLWMYWQVPKLSVDGIAIVMPFFGAKESWGAGTLGPWPAWLFWYFICSLSFTQIIRKALNVQTSPT